MSRLWVPPKVSRELQEGTLQHRQEIFEAARRTAICDYWEKWLKDIDPDLMLIQAHEDAQVPGMKPGYWHIVRDNKGAPPTLLPLVGDKGEFVEPTSRMMDKLREGDLQNPQAMEARRRQDEESARRRQRDEDRETEERQQEIYERWLAASRTQVSMNPDVPWTQNASAAARRDRDARKKKRA